MTLHAGAALSADWPAEHGRLQAAPMRAVRLGGFLGRRVDLNNGPSLAAGLNSPVFQGFEADAVGHGWEGEYRRRGAADTDLYKWLEAACYALAYGRDDVREAIDRVVETILAAQSAKGFVHTNRSGHAGLEPEARYELYLAGHLFEAAVAHHRATGEDALLDAARRWADYLHRHFASGHPYFDAVPEREHPEIELALVRLFRATGDERYLEFASDLASRATVTARVGDLKCGPHDRHAVCTFYMLAAWAELFLETGEERRVRPLMPLIEEIEATRLYIHGGVGLDEIIPGNPCHLPQAGSVAETCASVALMMFARRMHAITGQSRWFDLIERALYNAFLGALSADQLAIFYFSPLRVVHPGDEGRQDLPGERTPLPELHRTSCCFPNAWRMLASLPEWAFAVEDDALQVNLYADAECRTPISGVPVNVRMRTDYPADGRVEIAIEPERPARFRLRMRIPRWCRGATVRVAGGEPDAARAAEYHVIDRVWQPGDAVVIDLPMPPGAIMSRPEITCNAGQVAFGRGPVLYCLEEQDARGLALPRIAVPDEAVSEPCEAAPIEVCGGLPVLQVPAGEVEEAAAGPAYRPWRTPTLARVNAVTLIPWFARGNRESRRWRALLPVAVG